MDHVSSHEMKKKSIYNCKCSSLNCRGIKMDEWRDVASFEKNHGTVTVEGIL